MQFLIPLFFAFAVIGPVAPTGAFLGFEGDQLRAREAFVEQPLAMAMPGTPEPLDDASLQYLSILDFGVGTEPGVTSVSTLGAAIGLAPGGAVVLVLGVYDYEVCGIGVRCFVPAPVSAAWSVTPDDGARIDPATGLLTIGVTTTSGSTFTVSADIEGGRHVVTTEVYVYTPEGNPLVGYWREEAQLACDGGMEVIPELFIEELVFAADGSFAVTWTPFESYVDYWGTYTFDLAQGTLDLKVSGGNEIPPDVDGHGRLAVDTAGRLVLTDLWLGTPRSRDTPPHCGHRFIG